MTYRQDPPFAVQIELAEGCNLYCGFCGLRGIRDKPGTNYKFMERSTLRTIMDSIAAADGWNPRIEFAMHGEPTIHPEYTRMVRTARKYAPKLQLMMTSNGGGLLKKPGPTENVIELFQSGLNVLALDDYEGVKIVDKVVAGLETEEFATAMSFMNIEMFDYPKEPKGNPHVRRPLTARVITVIQDISTVSQGKGTHSHLNNHAGAGAPLNKRGQGKRCAKPFREMSFRWDGSVAICCNDWRGVYKCGNINEQTLLEIWHGPEMNAARHKLYHGKRDFGPCKGCDAMSHRVGLLPDKLGKVNLPEPTRRHLEVIEIACSGKPYTAPVFRPWEVRRERRSEE